MEASQIAVQGDRFWRFHHIGFVVSSIEAVAERFASSIGVTWNRTIIHDPLQAVRVSFIQGDGSGFAQLELVEPAGENSPVERFLQRGGGLHHLCYEVSNLDEELTFSRSVGGLVVRRALPAVAFGGRRIAWVLTRDKLLLEFLESAV